MKRIVALLAIAGIAGCSQAGTTMPNGPPFVSAQDDVSSLTTAFVGGSKLTLKFFNTPSVGAWPEDIISGPQGALWFSEYDADKIGRITTNGQITEFPLPDNNDIEALTEGTDGNLWFTEPGANLIRRMTPTGQVKTFQIPAYNTSPRGITTGPDGNVWYVEYYDNYIGRVTPSGQITRFAIPDYAASPWEIVTGADGDLYFTESIASKIGRFNPRTLQFKPSLVDPTPENYPWGIALIDKRVWFTEDNGHGKIAVVGAKKKIFEFSVPQSRSYSSALTIGSDGNLWFTENQIGNLGRFDLATGKFLPIMVLPSGSFPYGITSGPDKNIWFTIASYTNPSQIGEVVLH